MNRFRKTTLPTLIAVLLAVIMVSSAFAGSWSFSGGVKRGSVYIAEGSTLKGIGGTDFDVELNVWADVWAMCENPKGKQAPGRNPVFIEAGEFSDGYSTTKNGKYTFLDDDVVVEITAEDLFAVSPHPKELGCPNNNWTVTDVYQFQVFFIELTFFASGTEDVMNSYKFQCNDDPAAAPGTFIDCWEIDYFPWE